MEEQKPKFKTLLTENMNQFQKQNAIHNNSKQKKPTNWMATAMKYLPQVMNVLKDKKKLYSIIGIVAWIIISGIIGNLYFIIAHPLISLGIAGGIFLLIMYFSYVHPTIKKLIATIKKPKSK